MKNAMALISAPLLPRAHGSMRPCTQTEDTLVHVQWYERTAEGRAAEPVDDVIVFPGEAMLEKVRWWGGIAYRAMRIVDHR